jgi:DNA-binding GntR family transcriptional regulator
VSVLQGAAAIQNGHQPLRDIVAGELRRLIVDGTLEPGERLVEDRLAEMLGVSRNPIREAIRILEAEGFIDFQPRKGASVATPTEQQAADMFDLRLALEPMGARLAARRPDPARIAQMKRILEEAQGHTPEHDRDELSDLHSRLHSLVFEMTGNPYLITVALPMVKRGQWLLRRYAPLEDPGAWDEHHAIIAAIEAGDEEAAETRAREHVESVRAQLTGRIG